MLRSISSRQTFFVKFVFGPVWTAGFGAGTLVVLLAPATIQARPVPLPPWLPWLFLVAWVAASYFIWKTCIILKRVRMDDRLLHISNYRMQIEVPLRNVTDVRESRWNNAHPVTVTFEHDTAFGRSITFLPKVRFFPPWSPHPVVREILDAARRSRE